MKIYILPKFSSQKTAHRWVTLTITAFWDNSAEDVTLFGKKKKKKETKKSKYRMKIYMLPKFSMHKTAHRWVTLTIAAFWDNSADDKLIFFSYLFK